MTLGIRRLGFACALFSTILFAACSDDPNTIIDAGVDTAIDTGNNVGDRDGDGIDDEADNCPDNANADQANHDSDSLAAPVLPRPGARNPATSQKTE